MTWRFRKRLRIFPGVHLNVGKRGVSSVSVGPRGASVSLNSKGGAVNVGVAGTGFSWRNLFKWGK